MCRVCTSGEWNLVMRDRNQQRRTAGRTRSREQSRDFSGEPGGRLPTVRHLCRRTARMYGCRFADSVPPIIVRRGDENHGASPDVRHRFTHYGASIAYCAVVFFLNSFARMVNIRA